jgi:hypothetical protein
MYQGKASGKKETFPKSTPGKERRRHERVSLDCPIVIYTPTGRREMARARTDNISDGGCYVILDNNAESKWVWTPQQTDESPLMVELKIPRRTPNTYLLEPVRSPGRIVRIEKPPLNQLPADTKNDELGLALQFKKPLALQLG